ncbi:MAG: putative glycoside hydrolase [Clostridia bacterium]|nr:putative glycoside hydrolase [Clostridia bacterium]
MRFALQIFTGAFFSDRSGGAVGEQIRRRLADTVSRIDVSDVIIGWNTDAGLNAVALDIIRGYGLKAWLWLPVFSEVPPLESPEPRIGFSGAPMEASSAGEENFAFVCPSAPVNREFPLRMFDRFFAGLRYDGVFLDKIRQSSFAGGLEQGIGCLCERCRARYGNVGVDMDALARHVRDGSARMLPVAREGLRYRFGDRSFDRYFRAKSDCVTEAVSFLSGAFRQRGLAVGLDVFAPLVAWYTGQDLAALAETADFIKPMLYLRTYAPAGVPYELDGMRAVAGPETRRALHALFGAAEDDAEGCATMQAEALTRVKCPVWPGFEINRIPGVCGSDPAYTRASTCRYADSGMRKAVLSWDLLSDTGANIAALSNGLWNVRE